MRLRTRVIQKLSLCYRHSDGFLPLPILRCSFHRTIILRGILWYCNLLALTSTCRNQSLPGGAYLVVIVGTQLLEVSQEVDVLKNYFQRSACIGYNCYDVFRSKLVGVLQSEPVRSVRIIEFFVFILANCFEIIYKYLYTAVHTAAGTRCCIACWRVLQYAEKLLP